MMTVTWIQNSDGKYLVESTQHLLQIMNKGALYTDAGDAPTDYWSSEYLQTSDIDLQDDHANISPIGVYEDEFTGEYDGGLFQIKNWSYTLESGYYAGLFGKCTSPSVLKHIRLSGVWTAESTSSTIMHTGFLSGSINNSNVSDIEGDFADGTSVKGQGNVGGLIAWSTHSPTHGLTIRGTIDIEPQTRRIGGIFSYVQGGRSSISQCRNLATFPNGIRGSIAGGIVGSVFFNSLSFNGPFSNCQNAMIGDIVGEDSAGGLCGKLFTSCHSENLVNSMSGNITSEGAAGGVFGQVGVRDENATEASSLLNYMRGDIEGAIGAGGIVGQLYRKTESGDPELYGQVSITKSIVAMHGTVDQSVRGSEDFVPSELEVTVDTGFGMTYASNDYGSATMVVDDALVYHASFTDLPYFETSLTDDDGQVYNWDFVFANVGGKAAFDAYTHLSVHTAQVSAPFHTDFGLAEENDVAYLTYANVDENSLYIDSNLTISETTADIAFDYSKSTVVYGTPDPLETLAWTKNADGKYEVATVNHMLQLMSEGTMYTDLGDHPRDYWSSAYIQTSDIDLQNDHASIARIGNDTTQFTGEYDGGLFQISNWAYAGGTRENKTGLFGYCIGATLTHLRLAGAWSLSEAGFYSGFLCGYAGASTMYDVEGDFSSGTILEASGVYGCGSLLGLVDGGTLCGLTLRGIVDVDLSDCHYVGGVIGYLRTGATLSHCRNLATFTNGIAGITVGGVIGTVQDANISNCLNAITGDIQGSSFSGEFGSATISGGVCGSVFGTCEVSRLVNAMTGGITSLDRSGGIVGLWSAYDLTAATGELMLNYMKGDVLGAGGAGGIVGSLSRGSASGDESQYGQVSITKSVVAMHGNVAQAVRGVEDFSPSMIEVTVDTSFGMFFDTNDYGSSTMVVDDALVYHPQFTDLPYFVLSGTDPDGNEYGWDFEFPNIGGKFADYTHLRLHASSEILAPIPTTLGSIADDSDVVYLTYTNVDENSLYIDSSLTITETTAGVVFDHTKTVVVYGTPTPATTILWTQDADDKFEVATKEYLLQLMNKGALYTDLGAVRPSSYWTHHYVQTADIDLVDDEEHIVCIGDEDTSFVGSYEHDGFGVFNWQHGDEDARLFGDRTTLMWTRDAEGRYEVATAEHLLQIMDSGEMFVNEGDFPSDHWGESAVYIQTADIDLQDWHAKIYPIGNATTNFFGQYDGGGHTISNWSYTQPEDSATVTSTGLFGVVADAEIKGVRLHGVWTLNGSAHASTYLGDGFLCGTATGSTVYDIDTHFSTGTLMAGGSSTTAPVTHRVGGLIGYASESVVCNVTLKGTVELKDFGADGHNTYVGGVIGYVINAASSISLCRNVATFPSGGITGQTAGGLIGYFHMGTLSHSLNAMQGDVIGITHAGGICGVHAAGGLCEVIVNAMTGNIQATENAGGMHGSVNASGTDTVSFSQLLNYMSGSVQASAAGGIVGLVTRSTETGDVGVTNSIVAMNGTVDGPIRGSETFAPSALDAVVNTDFGMVYQTQIVNETTTSGFTTNPAFPDLPYIPLAATDPDGFSQEFDFVFANLGGNFVYSGLFTHLTLHTTTVSAPFATDLGLDLSNTQVYLTYANLAKSEIFVDDALTIVETAASIAYNHAKSVVLLGSASLPLICEPRALTVKASIDATGSQFQLTFQGTAQDSREIVAHDNFSESTKVITGLSPETTYVIKLYVNELMAEHVLVTTAANAIENYVVSDFYDVEQESYDISALGDHVSAELVNELFATGDVVEVDMGFARKTTMETTFVKKGELVEVDRSGAVLMPFDPSSTDTQESTIKLSDTTSVQVGLDASGNIFVGGNTYPSGESFVIDGRKCTIFDV